MFILLIISLAEALQLSSTVSTAAKSSPTLEFYNPSCPCNIVQLYCDDNCCCDSVCNSNKTLIWDQQSKCVDKYYAGLYSIPQCTGLAAEKTYLDLHQGLRIAYSLLKGLGCVSTGLGRLAISADLIISGEYSKYNLQGNDASLSQQLMKAQLITYPTNTLTYNSYVFPQKVKGTKYCQSKKIQTQRNYDVNLCLQIPLTASVTSITQLSSFTIYASNFSYISSTSTPTTYFGQIYSYANTTNAINLYYDNSVPSVNYLMYGLFINNSTTTNGVTLYTYSNNGKNGYLKKSSLRFMSDNNNELLNPLYIGISNELGVCLGGSRYLKTAQRFLFGVNQEIKCTGSLNYGTVFTSINQVAIFGDSNPSDASEWLKLPTECQTSSGTDFEFNIYYSGFGRQARERFQINNIRCYDITNTNHPSYKSLHIRFIDISNKAVEFYAPTPTVVKGLQTKVLAPFPSA